MAKNNTANQDYTNNADGWDLTGGTTKRKLTVTGGDITMSGSGANTFTFPSSSQTLVGRTSTDTLTGKTIVNGTGGNSITGLGVTALSAITGTPSSTTYLRGDGTWATVSASPEIAYQTSAPADTSVLWVDTDDSSTLNTPGGGNTGQVLTKKSNTDFDTSWQGSQSLGDFMSPASPNLYPPSDITSITLDNTSPAYSGQQSFTYNHASRALRYRYSPLNFTDVGGNGVNAINGAGTGASSGWSSFEVEFWVNGDRFALWSVQGGVQSDFRVYVDDMPLTNDWVLNTTTGYDTQYYKVQFATSRMRRVRIMMSGFMTFTAILVPGTSDIWAAPRRFRMAITGDSYVQGGHNGGTEGYVMGAGLCNQIALLTGWEVFNMGQGSTGYTNNGGNAGGKDVYGATSRLTAMGALPPLDLIMVYGSGNDSSASEATLTAAANAMWNALPTYQPTAKIIVAGMEPGSPTGFTPSLLDSANTYLKNAALANPNVSGFIDMRPTTSVPGDKWVEGTGNAGTPNDTGSQDFFIGPDAVHPTRAGYKNMADRIVAEMRKIRI